MSNTDLLSLAERVERAAGPDRELDGAIRKVVHGDFGFCGDGDGAWWCSNCTAPVVDLTQEPGCGAPMGLKDERRSYPSDWRDDERLPRYTASIDAAMTLAGDDFDSLIGGSYFQAIVADEMADAATPALALCAAALKARAPQ